MFRESADFLTYPIGLLLIVTKRFYTVLPFTNFLLFFLGLANDFSTNTTESVLCSTPKIKDTCLRSPSREVRQKENLVQV